MIANLVEDQKKVVASAQKVIDAAETAGNDVDMDLGTRRRELHEKNAWMLTSHLE